MSLDNLPNTGSENFETNCPKVLNSWKDLLEQRSDAIHTHNGGSIYYFIIFENDAEVVNNASVGGGELCTIMSDLSRLDIFDSGTSTWLKTAVSSIAQVIEAEMFD